MRAVNRIPAVIIQLTRAVYREVLIAILVIIAAWFTTGDMSRIIADGQGYYDYLPSVFIRHDLVRLHTDSMDSKKTDAAIWTHPTYVTIDGHRVNKYFCGVSVLTAPFFLAALTMAEANDDGYSPVFETAVYVAAIFYLVLGLIFLRRLLRTYQVKEWAITFTQLLITLGTSLLFYTAIESSFSHVFSFFAITAFAFYARHYFQHGARRDIILACTLFGIVLLIRPVNIMVLGSLPFLAGSRKQLLARLKEIITPPRQLALGCGIIIAIYGVQTLLWFLQSGHWFVDTYIGEHFDFTQPHTGEFLFGFRKGVFIYAPVLVLSIAGLVVLWRRSGVFISVSWVLFIAMLSYVLSCWHIWSYGSSFGSRVMVDYYCFFAIPLAFVISSGRIWNLFVIPFGLCAVALSVFQVWQYNHFYLLWDGMDYNKYKIMFLQYTPQYQGLFYKTIPDRSRAVMIDTTLNDVQLGVLACDTLFMRYMPASFFEQDRLMMMEYNGSFSSDDKAFVEFAVKDSSTSDLWSYSSPYTLQFMDQINPSHGWAYHRIPVHVCNGPQLILVRAFGGDEPYLFRHPHIVLFQ